MANPGMVIGGARPAGALPEVRDSLYKPSVWPGVTELLVGLDGSIWLRQPQPPAKSATFWRLTPDGKDATPVVVPSSVRPIRVSLNRIWGIAEDDDGVPSVHVLDVVPAWR
jgi:hypothetical protein